MDAKKVGFSVFLGLLFAVSLVFYMFGERPPAVPTPLLPESSPETSRSKRVEKPALKFLNTDLSVAWVGDENCENCHFQETESFRNHPMGRSMAKVGEVVLKPLAKPFVVGEYRYTSETRDGKVFHVEEKLDKDGNPVSRREEQVDLVMGSGTRGYAFLSQKDGRFFQSPIAWYTEQNKYDIAPGYGIANQHFSREILQDCFFCHTNRIENLGDKEKLKFHGLSIGCERCHGPGALHVEEQNQVDGYDKTIVNPVKLTPSRRDQVCYQCHLHIEAREESQTNPLTNYRPGLDLENYIKRITELTPDPLAKFKSVSHVQQMETSTCYVKSEGKLGCVTCHNPHDWPEPANVVESFRKKCLECHTAKEPCALPTDKRLQKSRNNNCIACHMPKQHTADIAHTVLTDHAIKRSTEAYRIMPDAPKGP